jgi:hypothetical protein
LRAICTDARLRLSQYACSMIISCEREHSSVSQSQGAR